MKKLLTTALLITIGWGAFSQEIPNNGMEQWESQMNGLYEEPGGNWWATMNFLRGFGQFAPITAEKTTDAYEGQYAIKLTSKPFGSFLIPGLIVSGVAGEIDLQDPTNVITRGQPFTEKPEYFRGYYKYLPQNGDSAVISAMVTKYDPVTQSRDTIAEATELIKQQVANYTAFNIPFTYHVNDVNPDTIIISLVSSAGAENLEGQENSTLFVDAMQLDLTSGLSWPLAKEESIAVWPNPADDRIHLQNDREQACELRIFNTQGSLLFSEMVKENNLTVPTDNWPSGVYFLQLSQGDKVLKLEKLIIQH